MYSRKINNDTLTIAPSGWTYKNTFVLYDKESESLWYPYKNGLMGIQGKYFKQWLPKLKSEDTQWRKWKNKHPNSKIME